MPSANDRIDINPSPDAGSVRAFGLALLVHALLIAALTWGVNWKRSDKSASFEAELWASVPVQAAPKLVESPPPPPPEASTPTPQPQPQPQARVVAPTPDVDIALEQEKNRKIQQQKQQQKEQEKQQKQQQQQQLKQKEAELLAQKDKALKIREASARQEQAKRLAEKEADKLAVKKQLMRQEADKQAQAATQLQRQDAMNRMMGLAGVSGATGAANAKGTAQRSSGPSASYGAKIMARVKPNIIFTETIEGNPSAEVEVRSGLDGTIMSQRLTKSSGNKAWDEAVLKAIIRTETMPRDVDGRVEPNITIVFSPKD